MTEPSDDVLTKIIKDWYSSGKPVRVLVPEAWKAGRLEALEWIRNELHHERDEKLCVTSCLRCDVEDQIAELKNHR